ncbi:hypothetical protein GQ44DRAFT_732794 [Phaeosphaeriaceae sp. PMI808]|nr:hypothetical protein GQ44DRAFT_732794 [Phaeosphaeriaceae sp. PMI808]
MLDSKGQSHVRDDMSAQPNEASMLPLRPAAANQSGMAQREPLPTVSNNNPLAHDGKSRVVSIAPTFGFTPTKPIPRAAFLLEIPEYAYIMPQGPPLNFTMTEIVVILPNWFRHRQMANRFQNNGITSSIQFKMLQRYRGLAQTNLECARSKDGISDSYRKVMRYKDKNWTKSGHEAPKGWDENNLAVNDWFPDSYPTQEPCRFKDLMQGLVELPQQEDAGDLTRALQFAIKNNKLGPNGEVLDYMFPDDIHIILGKIQYTSITVGQTDIAIIKRYDQAIKCDFAVERKRRRLLGETATPAISKRRNTAKANPLSTVVSEQHTTDVLIPSTQLDRTMTPSLRTSPFTRAELGPLDLNSSPQPIASQSAPQSPLDIFKSNLPFSIPNTPTLAQSPLAAIYSDELQNHSQTVRANTQTLQVENGSQFPPSEATINSMAAFDDMISNTFQDMEEAQAEVDEFDAMIAMHQQFDFSMAFQNPSRYSPLQLPLLRDCVEADDLNNHSDLARAGRWCRNHGNHGLTYTIYDVEFVLDLEMTLGNNDLAEQDDTA